jgi:hypothetical protein
MPGLVKFHPWRRNQGNSLGSERQNVKGGGFLYYVSVLQKYLR